MSKRKTNRSITCEPLEERRMFVTYQVTGTSGADAISISISGNSIISAVNGVSDSASDIVNNNVEINGMGGNDTITIVETGANTVVVNAGNGFDTINIALGTNDLDNIDDNITVNGEGDTDTVNLCDNGNATAVAFSLNSGNVIGRTSMPSMTVNAEIVEVRGGTSADTFNVSDAPTFLVTRLLGNGGTDVLNLVGAAGETARFQPNSAVANGGSVFFPADDSDLTFSSMESMQAQSFDDFILQTPNPNDTITLSGGNSLTGSSGGVAFCPITLTNLDALTLDVGANDGGAGNDTLTFSGTTSQADLINVNAETGTNTLTNSGNFTIDTGLGANDGNNLKVVDNGGALSFHGIQALKRLEVNSGGVVRFDGVDTRISVQELAVISGVGTFDMAVNQNASVPPTSSFSIGNGCTFVKKGQGSMSINGTQSHATGAILKVEAGTLNVGSDAGTAGTHPLTLRAAGGVLNLQSTQHVKNVIADPGFVSMASNGSRVLVTEDASTGAEGGVINLNNNDMMVVNPSASVAANVVEILQRGFANGGWDGLGINSQTAANNPQPNTAIAMLTGNDYFNNNGSTTFDGQVVHGNDLLLKYTYYGDVDFNGSVDASDYNLIDFGFGNHLSGWAFGDVDGSGSVDASDYNVIDFAYSTQGAAL